MGTVGLTVWRHQQWRHRSSMPSLPPIIPCLSSFPLYLPPSPPSLVPQLQRLPHGPQAIQEEEHPSRTQEGGKPLIHSSCCPLLLHLIPSPPPVCRKRCYVSFAASPSSSLLHHPLRLSLSGCSPRPHSLTAARERHQGNMHRHAFQCKACFAVAKMTSPQGAPPRLLCLAYPLLVNTQAG